MKTCGIDFDHAQAKDIFRSALYKNNINEKHP